MCVRRRRMASGKPLPPSRRTASAWLPTTQCRRARRPLRCRRHSPPATPDRLHARRSPTDRSLPVPLARNTLVLRRSPHRAPHSPGQQSSSRAAVLICVCGARARAKKGLVAVLTPSPTPAQAAAQGGKAKSQSNGTPKSRSKKQKTARDLEREAADATDHELLEAPTHLFRCSVRHTQSSLESTRGPTV